MADTDYGAATRRSPLAHLHGALAAAPAADAAIAEVPFQEQTIIRGDPGDAAFREGCAGVLGFSLPERPNSTTSDHELTVLRLGPDEWLVIGPDGTGEPLRTRLAAALDGLHAAVVDVGASRTVLQLTGRGARDVLEKGCILDLHPRAFPPGGCAQTAIGPAQVILLMRDDAPTWWVLVRSSYADWFARWLMDSAANSR